MVSQGLESDHIQGGRRNYSSSEPNEECSKGALLLYVIKLGRHVVVSRPNIDMPHEVEERHAREWESLLSKSY